MKRVVFQPKLCCQMIAGCDVNISFPERCELFLENIPTGIFLETCKHEQQSNCDTQWVYGSMKKNFHIKIEKKKEKLLRAKKECVNKEVSLLGVTFEKFIFMAWCFCTLFFHVILRY